MFWSHDWQVKDRGKCLCRCHSGGKTCNCGWWFTFPQDEPMPAPRKMRKVNLESRVKPFQRTLATKRWSGGTKIAVTMGHGFHPPTDVRARR